MGTSTSSDLHYHNIVSGRRDCGGRSFMLQGVATHLSYNGFFFFFWAFYKSMINLISIVWDAIPSASFSLCLEVLCAHFIHQIGFFFLAFTV